MVFLLEVSFIEVQLKDKLPVGCVPLPKTANSVTKSGFSLAFSSLGVTTHPTFITL
jgi:hypothetical protein